MMDRKIVLFLGASITQGLVSSNYVRMLKKWLGTRHYKFINQGVAGFESYNVLKRLDKAIKSKPDYVILLVGTNDVISSLDPELAKLSRKLKKIPHEPTLQNYSKNITHIVQKFRKQTEANMAIASLPVLGENLDSVENRSMAAYNGELLKISQREDVPYLPVNEKQTSFLKRELDGRGKDYIRSQKLAYSSLLKHYLLFRSFDAISRTNGYLLLTDGIHQNSLGAKFIAEEIAGFIAPDSKK
jgi:lysophospholipase L1-like esterase